MPIPIGKSARMARIRKPVYHKFPYWILVDLVLCLFIIGILIFFWSTKANCAINFIEASTYLVDEASVTIGWDAPGSGPVPNGYEVELRCYETLQVFKQESLQTSLVINRPRTGHFQVFVRSYLSGNPRIYSSWADSITSGAILINNVKVFKPWIFFWRIPPPSGGGIE